MAAVENSEAEIERLVIKETVRYQELKEILAKTESENTVMIKSKPKKRLIQTERGSKYRGVSKNGKKWQVSLHNEKILMILRF